MQRMQRGRWARAGIAAVFISVLVSITLAAINGIIGNRADALLGWLGSQLSLIKSDQVPWFVALVAVVICLVIFIRSLVERTHLRQQVETLGQENRVLQLAFNTQHNIVLLDDSLLRLLGSWIPSKDHESEMKRILSELLSDASEEFNGFIHRASLLRPLGDELRIWAHFNMPDDSVKEVGFFIGSIRSRPRGIAGEVFLKQQLCVAHMVQTTGGQVCDNPHFTNGRRPLHPLYKSFVAIPIIGVPPTSTAITVCLGVVCFDSFQPDIFDSPENQEVLRTFARRIAAALLICEQLP